jgi:hypothetical protein
MGLSRGSEAVIKVRREDAILSEDASGRIGAKRSLRSKS